MIICVDAQVGSSTVAHLHRVAVQLGCAVGASRTESDIHLSIVGAVSSSTTTAQSSPPSVAISWLRAAANAGPSLLSLDRVPFHSIDPKNIFSGVVVAASNELSHHDKAALFGSVKAFGGDYRLVLSPDTTHFVALSVDSDQAKIALKLAALPQPFENPTLIHDKISVNSLNLNDLTTGNGLRLVLPHYFDDCIKLKRRVKETAYCLPNPAFYQLTRDLGPLASQNLSLTPEIMRILGPIEHIPPVSSSPHLFKDQVIYIHSESRNHVPISLMERIEHIGGTLTQTYKPEIVTIVILLTRDGNVYVQAETARKVVATPRWLHDVVQRGFWTDPRAHLLHYPRPLPVPEFKSFKICATNYVGQARADIETMVTDLGGTYTKQMTKDNTHVICARPYSKKASHALEWDTPVLNHVWLEDCYNAARALNPARQAYLHYPIFLGAIVGCVAVDARAVERSLAEACEKLGVAPDRDMPMETRLSMASMLSSSLEAEAVAEAEEARREQMARQRPYIPEAEVQEDPIDAYDSSPAQDPAPAMIPTSSPRIIKHPLKIYSSSVKKQILATKTSSIRSSPASTSVKPKLLFQHAFSTTLSPGNNAIPANAAAAPITTVAKKKPPARTPGSQLLARNPLVPSSLIKPATPTATIAVPAAAPAAAAITLARRQRASPVVIELDRESDIDEDARERRAVRDVARVVMGVSGFTARKRSAAVVAAPTSSVKRVKGPEEVGVDESAAGREKRGGGRVAVGVVALVGNASTGRGVDVRVICTAGARIERNIWKEAQTKLGAKDATTIEACTHLVSTKIVRTEKFITAIVLGKEIVTPAWVEESIKAERWLNPKSYRPVDDTAEFQGYSIDVALADARKRRLFEGYHVYATPQVNPDWNILKHLVEAAGGKMIKPITQRKLLSGDVRMFTHIGKGGMGGSTSSPMATGFTSSAESLTGSGLSEVAKSKVVVVSCDADEVGYHAKLRSFGFAVHSVEIVIAGLMRQRLALDEFLI
ncbi:hypothetical protein BC830DRAFT_1135992, partial [Chytriomyces sp. MP71]